MDVARVKGSLHFIKELSAKRMELSFKVMRQCGKEPSAFFNKKNVLVIGYGTSVFADEFKKYQAKVTEEDVIVDSETAWILKIPGMNIFYDKTMKWRFDCAYSPNLLDIMDEEEMNRFRKGLFHVLRPGGLTIEMCTELLMKTDQIYASAAANGFDKELKYGSLFIFKRRSSYFEAFSFLINKTLEKMKLALMRKISIF